MYPEEVTGGLVADEEDEEVVFAVGSTCLTTFDPARNKWGAKTTSRSMRDPREGHSVVAMEGRIYAIGGSDAEPKGEAVKGGRAFNVSKGVAVRGGAVWA